MVVDAHTLMLLCLHTHMHHAVQASVGCCAWTNTCLNTCLRSWTHNTHPARARTRAHTGERDLRLAGVMIGGHTQPDINKPARTGGKTQERTGGKTPPQPPCFSPVIQHNALASGGRLIKSLPRTASPPTSAFKSPPPTPQLSRRIWPMLGRYGAGPHTRRHMYCRAWHLGGFMACLLRASVLHRCCCARVGPSSARGPWQLVAGLHQVHALLVVHGRSAKRVLRTTRVLRVLHTPKVLLFFQTPRVKQEQGGNAGIAILQHLR